MTGTMRLLEDPEEVRAGMRVLIGQLESGIGRRRPCSTRNRLDSDAALKRFRLLVFEIERPGGEARGVAAH